jgi:hypothetical protein
LDSGSRYLDREDTDPAAKARAISRNGNSRGGVQGHDLIPGRVHVSSNLECRLLALGNSLMRFSAIALAGRVRWKAIQQAFYFVERALTTAAARSPACRRSGTGDRAIPSNYATSYSLTRDTAPWFSAHLWWSCESPDGWFRRSGRPGNRPGIRPEIRARESPRHETGRH